MIDESRAHGLQAMYHAGATGALQALQEACTEIAFRIAMSYVKRLHLPYQRDRVEEIAHDAAASLIERYLKRQDSHVRRFSKILGYEVRDQLFVDPRLKQKTFEAKVVFKEFLEPSEVEVSVQLGGDAAMEIASSHRWGKKAMADLCRSRSYRQAIKRMAVYVERRWIYDHAGALHDVFRALHAKKGPNGSPTRSGLAGVRGALREGQRREREQGRQ